MSAEKFKFGRAHLPRYEHQKQGLRKLIETRGVCALLFDPGLGKSLTTLDYLSLLAFKNRQAGKDGVPEIRVLVVSPTAAVDTWPMEAEKWCSPNISVWAEALGGSIKQKAETLANRAGGTLIAHGSGTKIEKVKKAGRALHLQRAQMLYARRAHENSNTQPIPRDISELGPAPRLVLLSTNLDVFSSRHRYKSGTMADLLVEAVKRFKPDVIIIDESHKIKGYSSNVSRLMARLGELTPRRIMLTGTPMPHSPLDIFGQWRFLQPYAFGSLMPGGTRKKSTFTEFRARYANMGGFMNRQAIGFKNLDHMQEIMARNSIVAKKETALDLPATTPVEIPVELSAKERKAYEQMKAELATSLRDEEGSVNSTAANRLTQMLKLRQITAGYLKDDDDQIVDLGSSKIKTIASIANDTLAGEKRIVIFALYRYEIDRLKEELQQKGTEVLVFDGRTPKPDRLKYRQRFGSDDPTRLIMLAQIQTISVSVNELVTASHAIYATLTQRRDDFVQSKDRLDRIGQTKPVTFWFPLVKGSVDEITLKSHENRTDLENAVLDHIMQNEG